ncbi:MAG: ATP-binding protein [Bacillota bacterium]
MEKTWRKWFLTDVKRAIRDYAMISEGDRIAVGVSGGKDSIALLYILSYLRDYSHLAFDLEAILIDPGWSTPDYEPIAGFCAAKGVPFRIIHHPIAGIIDARGEKTACSLCAKLRSGILNTTAKGLGCQRVALGHHLDDAIETFFLNIIYGGRIKPFRPAVYLDRIGLYLIRPLIYLTEHTLSRLAAREGLPVLPPMCPYAGKTERASVKEIVGCVTERYPEFKRRFRCAMGNVSFEDLWTQKSEARSQKPEVGSQNP